MLRDWVRWEVGLDTRSSPKLFLIMCRKKNTLTKTSAIWSKHGRGTMSSCVTIIINVRKIFNRLWLFLIIILLPAHLEMMSPDNWTLINGLLSGWPALPSWSLADQMDSSAGIMNSVALTWNEGENFVHSQTYLEGLLYSKPCTMCWGYREERQILPSRRL